MKNCVYLSTGANLPDQNASALRISSIVSAFIENDFRCYVVGQAKFDPYTQNEISKNYFLYSIYNSSKKNSIKEKLSTFIFSTKKIKYALTSIEKQCGKIDCIVIYQQLPFSTTSYVIRYCKKRNIKLFFDIVEFQTISQQNLFTFFQFYLPNLFTVKHFSRYGKIICISTYLNKLMEKRQTNSIYVPFFFDVDKMVDYSGNKIDYHNSKLKLLYAGCPSRGRDTIVNAIKGILLLPPEIQKKIEFKIAGATLEQMIKLGLTKEEAKKSVLFCECLGKIAHEEVEKLYRDSHFSILLKPSKKRFSKAGFPTKVSESWAYGTPVLANLSGDLYMFLSDGFNGFICENDSPIEFGNTINKVFNITMEDYKKMCKNSRNTAENKLSLSHYSKTIGKFIK